MRKYFMINKLLKSLYNNETFIVYFLNSFS